MTILKVYLAGLVVLAGAIVLNVLAGTIGLTTWYGFLTAVTRTGMLAAAKQLRVVEWLFLLVIYPACLGGFAWVILCRPKSEG